MINLIIVLNVFNVEIAFLHQLCVRHAKQRVNPHFQNSESVSIFRQMVLVLLVVTTVKENCCAAV